MKKKNFGLAAKRLVDLIGSGAGLILFAPVFIITIILIGIFMHRPIFFTQKRIGVNRRVFEILKFRTMKVDKDAERDLNFSKDEKRLTLTGIILRRFKIDELPQLINVFKGDMSLVGPRPTVVEQVAQYTPYQMQRLKMKPGMTGLAQVNGNITLSWEKRIDYDVEYIKKFSILLDFKILIKTIAIVILGEEKFKKEKPLLG